MTGVYYSDLFEINEKGCLIMGAGKSKACRCSGNKVKEIGTDSIRLEVIGHKLTGYYDVYMGFLPIDKKKAPSCEISYLICMLSEEKTEENKIKEITKEEFIKFSIYNILFQVQDKTERLNEFRQIISSSNVICLAVPWCKTKEEKGKLISEFIR